MKAFLMALIAFSSFYAHADIIQCSFVLPYLDLSYSTSKNEITLTDENNKVTTISNVSFQIRDAGRFDLLSQDKKVLASLTLDHQGSDGASDTVFPYSVELSISEQLKGFGGCESNYLHAEKPEKTNRIDD